MVKKFFKVLKKFMFLFIFFLGMNVFASENKNITFNSYGFVQLDHIRWDYKNDDFLSGAFLKKFSLFFNGEYNKNLSYFFHFNYKLKFDLYQVYVKYSIDSLNLKFGRIFVPFSLEETINSNHRIFMERCLLESIIENKFLGFSVNYSKDILNFSFSVIVPELMCTDEKKKNNKYSFFFRGFMNPVDYTGFVSHFGFRFKSIRMNPEDNNSLGSVMFKDISSFDSHNPLLISHLASLPQFNVFGVEFIGIWEVLCIQAELNLIQALWKDYENEVYRSWYIQASIFLTGESKIYDFYNGCYFDPTPKYFFGSFEIAFRYSKSNMMNKGPLLRGVSSCDGKKKSINFCFNWLINNNFKLQINYANEEFDYRLLNSKIMSGIGFRLQFSF